MHPLTQAAKLIEEYAKTLNDTKSVCNCCGMTKYENWHESQAKTELSAILRKLSRWSSVDQWSQTK